MVKFPEATNRILKNVFVCRRCKTKMKSTPLKVLQKEIICRNCGAKAFRPIRRK